MNTTTFVTFTILFVARTPQRDELMSSFGGTEYFLRHSLPQPVVHSAAVHRLANDAARIAGLRNGGK